MRDKRFVELKLSEEIISDAFKKLFKNNEISYKDSRFVKRSVQKPQNYENFRLIPLEV